MENIKISPYRYIKYLNICGLLAMIVLFSFCNKEEIGTPVIYHVRTTTAAEADSFFTRSFPGKMIVVQGENFNGLQHVYMNNVEVSVNSSFVTNNNIVVTIPATLPLRGTDSSLPNTIKLVTKTGEVSYSFSFLSPTPTISLFKFRIPAKVDSTLKIYGSNFYEVKAVYFYRDATKDSIAITQFTVDKTYSILSVKIPSGGNIDGHISVVTESGYASATYLAAPVPIFTSYNNDMPIVGDTLVLTGKYLYSVQKVILPGGVEVASDKLITSELGTSVSLIMPALTQGGKVQIVCEAGTVESDANFNDLTKVIINFDGVGGYDWGDHNEIVASDGVNAPKVSTGKYLHIFGTPGSWQYWFGNASLDVVWPTTIPDNTPVSQLSIKMSFYASTPWALPYAQAMLGNWAKTYDWKPWSTATIATGKWVNLTLPLSNFSGLSTYADVKALSASNGLGLFFKNASADATVVYNYCFDNIRIAVTK